MIFLIINMILHMDDNILMWIELLPSLIMMLLFYFNSEVFVRCYSCVIPVSEMSKMSDVFLYALPMMLYCQ